MVLTEDLKGDSHICPLDRRSIVIGSIALNLGKR
jgi:hypothetical protein